MLGAEVDSDCVFRANGLHGKLRDHAIFVFDLDRQAGQAERLQSALDDGREFACRQPVVRVVSHPCLEAAEGRFAKLPAAIEKLAVDPTDFSDVRMVRNATAIGQVMAWVQGATGTAPSPSSNSRAAGLSALPALCGATLRIFYAFAVPLIGGRRFTTRRMLQDYGTMYYAPILLGEPFTDDPPLG